MCGEGMREEGVAEAKTKFPEEILNQEKSRK
jgi:hypothetical protein